MRFARARDENKNKGRGRGGFISQAWRPCNGWISILNREAKGEFNQMQFTVKYASRLCLYYIIIITYVLYVVCAPWKCLSLSLSLVDTTPIGLDEITAISYDRFLESRFKTARHHLHHYNTAVIIIIIIIPICVFKTTHEDDWRFTRVGKHIIITFDIRPLTLKPLCLNVTAYEARRNLVTGNLYKYASCSDPRAPTA